MALGAGLNLPSLATSLSTGRLRQQHSQVRASAAAAAAPVELLLTVNTDIKHKLRVLTDSLHFIHLKDGKDGRFYIVVFHFQNLAY